ncbi:MAG TPA: divergent polysaccharide deacetylase family protein [Candidatus Acidoferrum sp.]|nr:divergent polysaccharide deacetylase family protein [Candidatus Acidoferrum sp.]
MTAVQAFWQAIGTFSFHRKKNCLPSVLSVCLLVFFATAGGCKKTEPQHLSPAQIHSISRELAEAARTAAPAGTFVRVVVPTKEKEPGAADSLLVRLPQNIPENAAGADAARIQQALNAVATRHGLTQEPSESRDGVFFYYLKGGSRTHAVHIRLNSQSSEGGETGGPQQQGAKLAIILDDLGSDRAAAEEIFALPYPVTISVLPNHEHSSEIAHEALLRGCQVMLHLPMQAVATEKPEAQELRPGMDVAQVSRLLDEFLQNVPGAVGVNNHQGSQATADQKLMDELMPALRDRHLFYVDSRTTAATVAYEEAQGSGVPSAFRNVPFLDDLVEIGAVRKQLQLALRGARDKGEAIAIGHPHAATLQALQELPARAKTEGVRLVPVSELVH